MVSKECDQTRHVNIQAYKILLRNPFPENWQEQFWHLYRHLSLSIVGNLAIYFKNILDGMTWSWMANFWGHLSWHKPVVPVDKILVYSIEVQGFFFSPDAHFERLYEICALTFLLITKLLQDLLDILQVVLRKLHMYSPFKISR